MTEIQLPEAAYHTVLGSAARIVAPISIGAVFFGAMTYIGNGPNFTAVQRSITIPTC